MRKRRQKIKVEGKKKKQADVHKRDKGECAKEEILYRRRRRRDSSIILLRAALEKSF